MESNVSTSTSISSIETGGNVSEGQTTQRETERGSIGTLQVVYNVVVLMLSSVTYGYGLTSIETFSNQIKLSSKDGNYGVDAYNILVIFAVSNIYLGGLISNFLVRYIPRISKKHMLIIGSVINASSYTIQYFFPEIIIVSITRICIGLASGIVCAIVPGFLFDCSSKKSEGFVSNFHTLGINLGVVLGYLFGRFNSTAEYHIPMFSIIGYSIINSILLLFVTEKEYESTSVKHLGVSSLFKTRQARKSILTSCIFHLSQHLCGVDFVALFAMKFIGNDKDFYLIILSSLSVAIPFCLISSFLIDKYGTKPLMLASCTLLCIVTLLFGLTDWHKILIYFFVLSYNLGIGPIPWCITNKIFPPEYFRSGNMIGVTMNWLSAYILAISGASIFDYFGEVVWYIFSGAMLLTSAYTASFFKETKEMTVSAFQ